VCAAAHLFQRVGMQRPQILSAHNLTPQRVVSAVPGGEVFGSTSETARQVTGSADETVARTEERQTRGVFE